MFNFSDLHISINPFICAEIASSARAIGASLRKGVDRHKPDLLPLLSAAATQVALES